MPLAALFAELGPKLEPGNAIARMEQWYWSGMFGEMYGPVLWMTQYTSVLTEEDEYIREC